MILNVDLIYPVGSIYMNVTNPTDPGVLFGGTWKKIPYRYLVGEGTIERNSFNGYGSVDDYAGTWGLGVGMTFGEIKHQLNTDEMPNHNHSVSPYASTPAGGGVPDVFVAGGTGTPSWYGWSGYAGGNQPHNNIPPSLSVYMWQRIA